VIPALIDILGAPPASVLDVGCGVGTWLRAWQDEGVSDVLGIDGDYVSRSGLLVPIDQFEARNLAEGFDLGRTFELVQSLEVAEHIPPPAAETFVDSLVRHGDTVLFSAAVPAQSGKGHVNERLPSYWARHFRSRGYELCDVVRWRIWDRSDIGVDYRQNLLIFATKDKVDHLRSMSVDRSVDVVHLEMLNSFSLRRSVGTAVHRVQHRAAP
jgi:hypothetical protein